MQIKGLIFVSDTDIDMAGLDECLGKRRDYQGQRWNDQGQFHRESGASFKPMQTVCN
jgi:hypothetical protein